MKKLRLLVDFEYDDVMMHDDDKESIDWFFNDILFFERLAVMSSEIGDEIGTMKVLEKLDTESTKS